MKNPIIIGKIVSAHGIKGAVKIKTFTEDPESIINFGKLFSKNGQDEFNIKNINNIKGEMVTATISGIDDRNKAESLRGIELYIERDKLPKTDQDEFYYEDLKNLQVALKSGEVIGKIKDFQNFGAGDIAVVELTNGEKELFSFTKEIFPEINIENNTITIDPPENIYIKND